MSDQKKILMLHGLAQTGEYFESKTKKIRLELEKIGYKLYYPTAPNSYDAADLPDELLGDVEGVSNGSHKVTAWLEDDIGNNTYHIPPTTINFLHDYIIENGPFDGIIGFSQGAGLAGYLITDLNEILGLTEVEQPKLKFCMVFSGFRLAPERYQAKYDDNEISIPTLHVQGELDTITSPEKVMSLFNSCNEESRTFLKHKGGHFIPTAKSVIQKIIEWLLKVSPTE